MTKELNPLERLYQEISRGTFIYGKDWSSENAETSRDMKKGWKTREIISPTKRVITTPAGTFFITEENNRTIQLTKVDHLPLQSIIKAYSDFRS
jgi:hypothetical protein